VQVPHSSGVLVYGPYRTRKILLEKEITRESRVVFINVRLANLALKTTHLNLEFDK